MKIAAPVPFEEFVKQWLVEQMEDIADELCRVLKGLDQTVYPEVEVEETTIDSYLSAVEDYLTKQGDNK